MTFSARVTSYLVGGAVAAALLFYGFGQLSALLGRQDAEITDASLARIHAHPALTAYRGKLLVAEQRLSAAARLEATTADSLRRLLASGQRVDTVTVLQQIAMQDSTAYQACSVAFRTCQERATSAENEANSLAQQLAAQVKVRDHRFGVFVGAGVGGGKGSSVGGVLAVGWRLWP